MPIQRCNIGGDIGYKYGEGGKCYTYQPGDEAGRKRAKTKAAKQGAAIEASKARAKKKK